MTKINISDSMLELLKKKDLINKNLLLITDDGGGKYSLQGGACSIGAKFSIVELDQPDPEYPIEIENNHGIKLFTSSYDQTFLGAGLTLDFKRSLIILKDNSGRLDGAVTIANGKEITEAFEKGTIASGQTC